MLAGKICFTGAIHDYTYTPVWMKCSAEVVLLTENGSHFQSEYQGQDVLKIPVEIGQIKKIIF